MGQQTVNNVRLYMSPKIMSHHKLVNTDYNKYFYTPRTLFTLALILTLVFAGAFGWCEQLKDKFKPYYTDPHHSDDYEEIRFPLLFGCLTIIGFAST